MEPNRFNDVVYGFSDDSRVFQKALESTANFLRSTGGLRRTWGCIVGECCWHQRGFSWKSFPSANKDGAPALLLRLVTMEGERRLFLVTENDEEEGSLRLSWRGGQCGSMWRAYPSVNWEGEKVLLLLLSLHCGSPPAAFIVKKEGRDDRRRNNTAKEVYIPVEDSSGKTILI